MKQHILFLLRTYVLTVLLFIAAKVAFMLCNGAGHGVTFADYFDVVRHGLSLDLSTALYFIIVPLLVTLTLTITKTMAKTITLVLKVYFAVISFAFALAFVADTSLYAFWGFKLDASCLQYLSQPEGMTQSVSVGYLLLRLLLIVVLTVIFFLLYSFRLDSPTSEGREAAPSIQKKVMFICAHVLLMPLIVIGIRGGTTESTTNIGQVYYSQNQFLNHAAVNPVFSFLSSLGHQLGDLSQYDLMSDDECLQLTENVFSTESVLTDTLLTTTRPDIVVILLESAGEEFASVMPRLQQLKRQGVCFSRCYANSWRTDRGTVCTLSGYPSFPTLSVMKMPEKSRSLPSIARTLQAQGYATSYLYGGDINFTNMRSYLIATGWQRLTSMDDYSRSDQHTAQWGVRDDITFNTLYQEIVKQTNGLSFLWGYSTLSSHEPWDVPVQKNADEVLNAFAYLDDCLYDFVTRLQQTPSWDNLLIIVTADHGINYKNIDLSAPLQKNHIPMLWLGGAVSEPRTVDAICNQSDLAATLLGQLQLPHDDFTFSRDVLSQTYTYPTAVHNYNNAQWIVDSTGHLLYDFDARRATISESSDAQRLQRVDKAIIQRTTRTLQERNY